VAVLARVTSSTGSTWRRMASRSRAAARQAVVYQICPRGFAGAWIIAVS
jgi:hypothetical protein